MFEIVGKLAHYVILDFEVNQRMKYTKKMGCPIFLG